MKTCKACNKERPLTEYYKQARNKDGLFHECKECCKEKRNKRYANNKEYARELSRKHYRKNKQYYITKGYLRAKGVQKAKPAWLTEEHKFMLEEIYDLRRLRTELTGVEHHVDHIVPLKGKTCCGLHVPWNLQVIPASENLSKSNSISDSRRTLCHV